MSNEHAMANLVADPRRTRIAINPSRSEITTTSARLSCASDEYLACLPRPIPARPVSVLRREEPAVRPLTLLASGESRARDNNLAYPVGRRMLLHACCMHACDFVAV